MITATIEYIIYALIAVAITYTAWNLFIDKDNPCDNDPKGN